MRVHHGCRSVLSGGRLASWALCCGLVALALYRPASGLAQEESLAKIDADYERQRARLDRERIERLTRLAESQKPGDAELTLLEVFRFAIAADRYADAEPAADRLIRAGATTREAGFLARLVKIVAEADRGDYGGSTRDLKAFLDAMPAGPPSTPEARTHTALAVGEAYLRRLVRAGRFDLARDACDLVGERVKDPAVREHFAGYRRRLELVGRPAPAIRGTDEDGAAVGLDGAKGKVVLVVFWATWCAPCIERLPTLRRALELHEKDGFAVLGVNFDDGPDRHQLVRRFVVDFAVPWPNVMNGTGDGDISSLYAVKEIPANVLIGRDGKVLTIDLDAASLLTAVSEATKQRVAPR